MTKSYFNLLSSCDVQTFRAGGKGGQHQNKTESGVRLVHRPTGLTVICRDERSQYLNKVRCCEILARKLSKFNETPTPRIATVLPQSRKIERSKKKKMHGRKKLLRKRPELEE
jgi:ribosome-associated protein